MPVAYGGRVDDALPAFLWQTRPAGSVSAPRKRQSSRLVMAIDRASTGPLQSLDGEDLLNFTIEQDPTMIHDAPPRRQEKWFVRVEHGHACFAVLSIFSR